MAEFVNIQTFTVRFAILICCSSDTILFRASHIFSSMSCAAIATAAITASGITAAAIATSSTTKVLYRC